MKRHILDTMKQKHKQYLIDSPAGSHASLWTQFDHGLHSDDTTQSTLIACDACDDRVTDGVTDGDCASVDAKAARLLVTV